MTALDDIVDKLDSQFINDAEDDLGKKAQLLEDLGYLSLSPTLPEQAFQSLVSQAFEDFNNELNQSSLVSKYTINQLKELYPLAYEVKLLERCTDIDEGIIFKKLPEFGDRNLKTRIIHFRLNLLGQYHQPIKAYYSASSHNGLTKAASFINKGLLATINMLADIQQYTTYYLKQNGYKHPVVIMQSQDLNGKDIAQYNGAFKRSVKRELGSNDEVFQELKKGIFKRNDDKVDVEDALSILENEQNAFIIRLIQIHQWMLGFYTGKIDGEIGTVSVNSLLNVISSYESSGESTADKKLLVILSEKEGLLAFNAIFFLNRYKLEYQSSDKTIDTIEKVNDSYLQASPEDQKLFEQHLNQNFSVTQATSNNKKSFLHKIFGGIRSFFKKAFKFGRKIFKWIVDKISAAASFITSFVKKLASFLKEAAHHFIEGVKFLFGKTTIASTSASESIITHFDLDKDVLNLGSSLKEELLGKHKKKVNTKVSELKFSLSLIAFLFKTIKSILLGGLVAWPLFILKLVKAFKQIENSYKQIATT